MTQTVSLILQESNEKGMVKYKKAMRAIRTNRDDTTSEWYRTVVNKMHERMIIDARNKKIADNNGDVTSSTLNQASPASSTLVENSDDDIGDEFMCDRIEAI